MIHPSRSLVSFLFGAPFCVTILLGALVVTPATASESTAACLDAYEAGQRSRHEGDLVSAADEFLVCGGPACPVRMQRDCQRWLDDVERSIPAVVFRVRDDAGNLLRDVTVSIDGGAPRRLTGRALLMNPGEHEVVFESAGCRPLRTPVFVTEGEKLEPREVTLATFTAASREPGAAPLPSSGVTLDARSAAAEEPSRSTLAWPLAAGALGLVGGAGFVYFGVAAQQGESDLARCTPRCSQAQVDDVKQDYLVSNVSLGISLVGLLGAGLLLLLDEPASSPANTGGASHGFTLGPTPSWIGRF